MNKTPVPHVEDLVVNTGFIYFYRCFWWYAAWYRI